MQTSNELRELRDIRDQVERCRELMRQRDALIRASAKRYPQRRIAQAAGVSRSRVQQISAS